MVEPNIDDKERWGSRDRPPFVRKIGGISLFDFNGFDPESYAVSHPLSSWQYFIPHRNDWGGAVWLNIDRAAVTNSFISAYEILARWDVTGNRSHNVMPRIEAAHLGNLPISAISSAFLTWDGGHKVRVFDMQNFDAGHFGSIIDEWHMAIGINHEGLINERSKPSLDCTTNRAGLDLRRYKTRSRMVEIVCPEN